MTNLPNRTRQAGDATAANRALDELLELAPNDLQNVLGIAREYSDHPSFRGRSGPAGTRLLRQIEMALEEYRTVT